MNPIFFFRLGEDDLSLEGLALHVLAIIAYRDSE